METIEQKQNTAKKSAIVESIQMLVESEVNWELMIEREDKTRLECLADMSLEQLASLQHELETRKPEQRASEIVVRAIHASLAARRKADDDAGTGPATIEL